MLVGVVGAVHVDGPVADELPGLVGHLAGGLAAQDVAHIELLAELAGLALHGGLVGAAEPGVYQYDSSGFAVADDGVGALGFRHENVEEVVHRGVLDFLIDGVAGFSLPVPVHRGVGKAELHDGVVLKLDLDGLSREVVGVGETVGVDARRKVLIVFPVLFGIAG